MSQLDLDPMTLTKYNLLDAIAALDLIAPWLDNETPYGDVSGQATQQDLDAGRELPPTVRFNARQRRINIIGTTVFTDEATRTLLRVFQRYDLHVLNLWRYDTSIAFVIDKAEV